ncbi:MAG: hypothetical protein OIN87_05780 [Candidatus Methanoperedens sp.]|nr:hypothetical protein [Candidatus Methanoperedens sp.]
MKSNCILVLLVTLFFIQPALAAVSEISSVSDFGSSATTINFDDLSVATHVGAQYSSKGVTFLDDKLRTPLVVNSNNRGSVATNSEPNSLFNDADYPTTNDNLPLEITFEKPVRKVGMYIGNGKQSQLIAVLSAFDRSGISIGSVRKQVPDPVTGFIGLKSDTDIYKVTLDYGISNLGEQIDDLIFEAAGPVIMPVKTSIVVSTINPIKTPLVVTTIKPIPTLIIDDTIQPTVSASHSPPGLSTSQKVTFTATASDAGGIHRLLIWVDGSYVKDCYDVETCTYTGGPYTSRVKYFGYAIDNAGNYKATGYKYIDFGPVDKTKPTVSASHTPNNPSTSQSVTFTATASDPAGIKRLLIWVDGSYVKDCPGSPCTYTGGPYAGPRVKYFGYAIDNYDNYAATDYKYANIGPIDLTLPEVYALHSPLHPTNGQTVTFTAKATDNHPSGIDHIWLWVDGSYVKRCDSDTCTYTGGPYSKNNIKYFALAYDKSGNRGFSGYIDFTVGPYSGNTVPILHTGDSRTKIDVVFIPSKEYDGNMAQFYSDISNSIKNGYYASDPIFKNRNKFNFYYFKNTVNVGTKTIPGVSGTLCDWSAPSGWGGVTFADSGAIIHRFDCRDSAGGGLFSSEWNSYRTLVHESGHAIFGIADEYCCDSYYFEPSPNPNIWNTLAKCKNAATANGWNPNDCVKLTDGTSSINWWKSDPEPDIMKTGGGTVWAFNRADMRNLNWLFGECSAGRC